MKIQAAKVNQKSKCHPLQCGGVCGMFVVQFVFLLLRCFMFKQMDPETQTDKSRIKHALYKLFPDESGMNGK